MTQMGNITILLGNEFDEILRRDLQDVLQSLGASIEQKEWGLAGSQEFNVMTITLHGHKLTIESETYIGLSITGPEDIVCEIKKLVEEKKQQRLL